MVARRRAPIVTLGGSAEEVETRFYEALQRADISALMSLWADDDDIVCVHPGGTRLIGKAAIRASFEAIFANGAIAVRPEQVRRIDALSSAIHHLCEHVELQTADGPHSAWVTTTNVYVKTPLGWRIAAHHASPGSRREPDEQELSSTLH